MALPGYFFSFFLIDRLGRKTIQITGFVAMCVLYTALGVILAYAPNVNKWIPTGIYGLTFFFSNFGPNSTTFILPSEIFPTEIRARCHGISAAAGKLGA